MLKPDIREAKRRRFKAYDLEWYPETLELRLLGCYDGSRYTWQTSVEAFLNAELTADNDGVWYFAHAGGLYDFQFLLEYIIEHRSDLEVDARFSGSSAVAVKLKKGKREWLFCDSFFLLRTSLAKIGEWLDFPKGDCAFDAPLPELIEYNQRDCEILYRAVEFLENLLVELGGELRPTIASCALTLFRRRFLSGNIRVEPAINKIARDAYIASRVEVFRHRCSEGNYYDINSSFPYSMTWPLPGNPVQALPRRMPGYDKLFLARATVNVPDTLWIPPLPYRGDSHRVYFPVGRWTCWFSSVDLELAEREGVQIERIHSSVEFEENHDARAYAEVLYEKRRVSTGALKEGLKILLNALYGKFGERGEKRRLLVNPPKRFFTDKSYLSKRMVAPGIWLAAKKQHVPQAHVPFSVFITAYSRKWLYQYLDDASCYCDTDGFITRRAGYPTGDALGQLKHEGEISDGHFVAPKLYTYESDGKRAVRAKGFRRIDYQGFCEIIEHRDFHFEHFLRIPERMAAGISGVKQEARTKTYRGLQRPKRAPDGNDGTRPWDVAELED